MPNPLSRYGFPTGTVNLRVSRSLDGWTGGELDTPRHSLQLPFSTLAPAPPPFVSCARSNSLHCAYDHHVPCRCSFACPFACSFVGSARPFARGPVRPFDRPFAHSPARFLRTHLPSGPALTRPLICSSTSPLRILPGRLSDQLPVHSRTHLPAARFTSCSAACLCAHFSVAERLCP